MNLSELMNSLGERLGASATAKTVYGEPVKVGGRTVVPVAKVRLGFGGGIAGGRRGPESAHSGGGGGIAADPAGALEVTEAGTRFIAFGEERQLRIAFALGMAAGALLCWAVSRPKR
jgi:uncharacterized spore protein YtfJ